MISRFVLALPLEGLSVGAGYSVREWPLHLTVVPTFEIAASARAVLDTVSRLVPRHPLVCVTGAIELFGARNTVPAATVVHSAELAATHEALVAAVVESGGRLDNPQYTGARYRPHVTSTRVRSIDPGVSMSLGQLVLVDMTPEPGTGHRCVVGAVELRD